MDLPSSRSQAQASDRSIKAGNYEIAAGVTLPRLLDKLTQGDVTQAALTSSKAARLPSSPRRSRANPAIVKTVLGFPRRAGAEDRRAGRESRGMVFSRHVFFRRGSPDLALLIRAHRLMQQRLDAAWSRRAGDSPLKDPYAALILARSSKRKRARGRSPADRVRVHQPAADRHAAPIRSHGDLWARRELRRQFAQARPRSGHAVQHVHADGLPPTPIALPGRRRSTPSSIRRRPIPLLRVARRRQQRVSTNLSDHNRAVARFQAARR
jgi:UPF0755 protein